jgi:hypothetical protein
MDILEKLEPSVADKLIRQEVVLASIAISLKRIADSMDGTAAGVDISESLCGARPGRGQMYR